MRITRQTESELVVVDSCLWLAGFLIAVALILFYAAFVSATHKLLVAGGCILLFAVPWLRKNTFTFDAAQRMVRYRVLRYLKTSSGSIPFAEITGIETETSSAPRGGTIYRLAILTHDGSVPMADAYGGGRRHYEDMRQAIEKFVNGDVPSAASQEAAIRSPEHLEASIRLLLAQGRKIDAIRMLRNDQDLDLSEATLRVGTIEKEMAANDAASPRS